MRYSTLVLASWLSLGLWVLGFMIARSFVNLLF